MSFRGDGGVEGWRAEGPVILPWSPVGRREIGAGAALGEMPIIAIAEGRVRCGAVMAGCGAGRLDALCSARS